MSTDELCGLYASHPIKGQRILQRLRRDGVELDAVRQRQLSIDEETEITDQNHVGGAAFTLDLAVAAEISPTDYVLDLGCGLGGAARLLAWSFGCEVDGIDISPARVADGQMLTELVELTHLVRLQVGDALVVDPPLSKYSVIWGQGAWAHFRDKEQLLGRWVGALKVGGRVALDEPCLMRPPVNDAERALIAYLEATWHAHLVSVEHWVRALEVVGFSRIRTTNLKLALARYYHSFTEHDKVRLGEVTREQRDVWSNAVKAGEAGLIEMIRIVANRD